jgi:hypothetical protein
MKSPYVVVGVLVALTACAQLAPPHANRVMPKHGGPEIAQTDIVQVTLQRHGCEGACPRDILTFSSDGRATYTGDRTATRSGSFVGIFDTDRLFAAIAATGVELDGSATRSSPIDMPYTTLHIDRGGATPIDLQAGDAARMPGVAAIVALAVAGADREVRWQRDDGVAPWLGPYAGGAGMLYLERVHGNSVASGSAALCHAVTFREARNGGALDVLCGNRRSRLVREGAIVEVSGSAIAPGRYQPITPHAYALATHDTWGE